ncbi:MAG: hypothetical protein COW72_00420, partial [Candidatus Nealsonbacteria bacterium CG18_big_fil_WC_8_21_14_2_50_37_10]
TIPKKITKGEELVIIPRKDYEKLLEFKKIPEFRPTIVQKKALIEARRNRKKSNFLTFNELKAKLGFTN